MKFTLLAGAALCVAGNICSASPARAQDASGSDIIVTATRREQALQKVPLAVTAVSAASLQARGVSALSDLPTGSVPGMNLQPISGSPSALGVVARGVGTPDPVQGTAELSVPLYIDGVALGRAQGSGMELIEPERIEFLRGPQGQLFGRNAEGGAIQYVSKKPSGKFGVDASALFGTYGENKEKIRVDLPEFANLKLQISYLHHERDGFTKNKPTVVPLSNKDFAYLQADGVRFAARWQPTDKFTGDYVYDYTNASDSNPYLVWQPVDIIGRVPITPQPQTNGYPDDVNSPIYNPGIASEVFGHALTLQYAATQNITLKSITSYREASRTGGTPQGDAQTAFRITNGATIVASANSLATEHTLQSQFSEELQAIGSWDRFDLTVGAIYFKEDVDDGRRTYYTGPAFAPGAAGTRSAGFPVGCIGVDPCLATHSEQNAESESYGVYAQGTYTPPVLNDKLELTVGLRYSDDSKAAERTFIQPAGGVPAGGLTNATPSGVLPPVAHFDAQRWDPAVTIKYNWTDRFNTYLRYATAYRAGGVSVRSSAFNSYKEEEIESWELGLKSQLFDKRLTFNLAAYDQTITGQQQSIQESPTLNPALTNTVNLQQNLKIKGLEIEASWRVMPGLTLSTGYSYMDAPEYEQFDNPLTATVGDITRFYTIQTPEHSGNVALDYTTPNFPIGKLAIHADYAYATGYYTTPGGLIVSTLGTTYDRPKTNTNQMNARISWKDLPVGPARGEIALWGKNLFDDNSYVYGFDGAAAGAGFAKFLVPPMTAGVEFRVTY